MNIFHIHKVYWHLALLAGGIAMTVWTTQQPWFSEILLKTAGFGYLGVFLAGVFYASALTAPMSIVVLSSFSMENNSLLLVCFGGLGAAMMDMLILLFVRRGVYQQVHALFHEVGFRPRRTLSVANRFLLTLVGMLVIASPLPDELGIGLLGFSKIRWHWFFVFVFVLNAIGIFTLVLAVRTLVLP